MLIIPLLSSSNQLRRQLPIILSSTTNSSSLNRCPTPCNPCSGDRRKRVSAVKGYILEVVCTGCPGRSHDPQCSSSIVTFFSPDLTRSSRLSIIWSDPPHSHVAGNSSAPLYHCIIISFTSSRLSHTTSSMRHLPGLPNQKYSPLPLLH